MLSQLQNTLNNVKYSYKNAMYTNRNIVSRINEYKRLELFKGNDRDILSNRLERNKQDVEMYRQSAIKADRQITTFKHLTGGEQLENVKIEKPVHIPLTVENDFSESDDILETGDYTRDYANTRRYYEERIDHDFNGSYPVIIERIQEYNEFLGVLVNEIVAGGKIIDYTVTFKEWESGYKVEGKRQSRLNKYLRKQGFSQYVIDYYSQQIRTKKELFLTISDRVQHVIGMSYYSNGEWTGMSGSSCQNPENDYEDSVKLLPSIHDNKLVIAFLHDELNDLDDMDEKMLARSVCRIIHIDGVQYLIGTNTYGSMETQDELEKALKQVNEYNIFAGGQMSRGENHTEQTNGMFSIDTEEEVYISNEYENYSTCECPACSGSGELSVYTNNDREVEIECPACSGSGKIEQYISVYIDEHVTVTDEEEITPYAEHYSHYGNRIVIQVNKEVIKGVVIDEKL